MRRDEVPEPGTWMHILVGVATHVIPAIVDGIRNIRNNEQDEEMRRRIGRLDRNDTIIKCLIVIIFAVLAFLLYRSFRYEIPSIC